MRQSRARDGCVFLRGARSRVTRAKQRRHGFEFLQRGKQRGLLREICDGERGVSDDAVRRVGAATHPTSALAAHAASVRLASAPAPAMSTVSARTADSVAVDDDAAPSSPTLVSTNRAIAAAPPSPRVAHISAATFASRANRESDVAARAATVSGTFTRISASNFAVAFDPAAARRAAGSTSALLSAARTLAASSGSSTTSTSLAFACGVCFVRSPRPIPRPRPWGAARAGGATGAGSNATRSSVARGSSANAARISASPHRFPSIAAARSANAEIPHRNTAATRTGTVPRDASPAPNERSAAFVSGSNAQLPRRDNACAARSRASDAESAPDAAPKSVERTSSMESAASSAPPGAASAASAEEMTLRGVSDAEHACRRNAAAAAAFAAAPVFSRLAADMNATTATSAPDAARASRFASERHAARSARRGPSARPGAPSSTASTTAARSASKPTPPRARVHPTRLVRLQQRFQARVLRGGDGFGVGGRVARFGCRDAAHDALELAKDVDVGALDVHAAPHAARLPSLSSPPRTPPRRTPDASPPRRSRDRARARV